MKKSIKQGAPGSEWRDVEVEMPDDEIQVLCCNSKTESCWVGSHEDGFWFSTETDFEIDVTHWMHLPEFPITK